MTATDAVPDPNPATEAFADKVFASVLGAMECLGFYAGERLGWFAALAREGPATAVELAERTGTDGRYAREWLEMQATFGHLRRVGRRVRRPTSLLAPAWCGGGDDRSAQPVLSGRASPDAGCGRAPPGPTAGGVSPRRRRQLGRVGRPRAARPGGGQPALVRVAARRGAGRCARTARDLSRPGARIVDVGCGAGWSSIALAVAYPDATVIGVDPDEPSIGLAEANATAPEWRIE